MTQNTTPDPRRGAARPGRSPQSTVNRFTVGIVGTAGILGMGVSAHLATAYALKSANPMANTSSQQAGSFGQVDAVGQAGQPSQSSQSSQLNQAGTHGERGHGLPGISAGSGQPGSSTRGS